MKLTHLLSSLLLLTPLASQGQFLARHIPNTAAYVLSMDLKEMSESAIEEKIQPLDEVRHSGSAEKGAQLAAQIAANPSEYGLNTDEKSFVYFHIGDTFQNTVILLAISDKAKFKEQAGQVIRQNNPDAKFIQRSGYEVLTVRHEGVAVNNDMAIIVFGKSQSFHGGYGYPSEYYTELREIEQQLRDDPESVTLTEEDERLLALYDQENGPSEEDVEMVEDVYEEDVEDAEATEVMAVEAVMEDAEQDAYAADPVDENHPKIRALKMKYKLIKMKREEEFYKAQGEATAGQLDYYFNLPTDQSLFSNQTFLNAHKETHDMTLWVSGNLPAPMYRDMYGYRYRRALDRGMEVPENKLAEFLASNYSVSYIDNEEGKLKVKNYQYTNKELSELNPLRMTAPNANFLNYISQNALLCYSANIDPEKTFDLQMYVWNLIVESLPNDRNSNQMLATMDMVDLFLNKEVIFKSLKGDAVFVVNRQQPQYKTRYKYEYDEETFESQSVEYIDSTTIPIFTAMMSVGIEENVTKLLGIYEKLELLRSTGDRTWEVNQRYSRNSSPNVHFGVRNGILFISNDSTLTPEQMVSGINKSDRISGEELKQVKNLINGIYVNTAGIGSSESLDVDLPGGFDNLLQYVKDGHYGMVESKDGVMVAEGTMTWTKMDTEGLAGLLELFFTLGNVH